METVELNVRAKPAYEAFIMRQRRNDMAKWRRCEKLSFACQEDFQKWLDYTKWHKRPMKTEKIHGMCYVTFLDFKGKKNG